MDRAVQVTVDTPARRLWVLRVAGRLDRAAAASVLRLLGVYLELIVSHHRDVTDLVLDLDNVASFEPGGLESLRHAPYSAGRKGIGLCLTGCGGRVYLLPVRAQQLLGEFRTFPTVEAAVAALTGGAPARCRQPGTADPGRTRTTDRTDAGAGPTGMAAGEYRPAAVVPAPRPPAEQVDRVDGPGRYRSPLT